MPGHAMPPTFACDDCGSVSLTLPDELVDAALVRCSRCGHVFGCWAEFKQVVEQIIAGEAGYDATPSAPETPCIRDLVPGRGASWPPQGRSPRSS